MRTGHLRTVVALLLAAFVAGPVTGCTDEPEETTQAPPPANLAFVDVDATAAVSNEVASAITRFFTYDFQHLDEHASQIMADSTAGYWTQVEPTLGVVREVATSKRVAITAEVVATSVHVLEPSRAELLLFVNRSITQDGGAPQPDLSSVIVTAARVGTAWKLDGVTVL